MSQFEREARELATDLDCGRVDAAANLLRSELNNDPRRTLALIQEARNLQSPNGYDSISVNRCGTIEITDPDYGRVVVGQLPETCHDRQYQQQPRYQVQPQYQEQPRYHEQPQYQQQPRYYPQEGVDQGTQNLITGFVGGLIGGVIGGSIGSRGHRGRR